MFDYTFHWRTVWKHWPELLDGAALTLELTALSIIIGFAFAVVLTSFAGADNRAIRAISASWVALARNTPALLQIYMAYFGLGALGIHLSPYVAVLSAIAFNNAGYLTEIFRGGIASIPPSQQPSAMGLGMSRWQSYIYVLFPQLLRAVFLPCTNQIVWAMMGTSLGLIIGLQDLAGMTTFLQSQTFRPFEFYLAAAVIYLIIAKMVIILARIVFAKLFRGWEDTPVLA